MSETIKLCPTCGGAIPANAPQGLCPKCVMAQAGDTETETPRSSPAEPPSVELLRTAFPDLEIQSLIGSGGMGAVYKARQSRLNRIVALKVLPESLAADVQFAERFEREAQLLARLNHPGIVTVYDFGKSGGFFYLLMEYINGVNLRQAMQAGRFSPEAALALVPHICEALQYAHGEGVLHRDIKPENILLDTRGRLKIADFGIAKMLGEKAGLPLTASGAVIGTPHYMAPEQFEKPREVDQRADIYSLGVVLYEMLTGELPVGRFAPPSEKSKVDPRIDQVVFRALEKERERRFGSAQEVKTSVERVTSHGSGPEPASTPPSAVPTRQTASGATVAAVLTCLSLVPCALVILAGLFVISRVSSGVALHPGELWLLTLTGLLGLTLGLAGALLGFRGLFQVKRVKGELRGGKRSLFAALTWPVLFTAVLTAWFCSRILFMWSGGQEPILHLASSTAAALAVGVSVVTAVWWWVTLHSEGARKFDLVSVGGAAAACLLIPAVVISLFAVNSNQRSPRTTYTHGGGLNRPLPILSSESLPPATEPLGELREGAGLDATPELGKGSLNLSFEAPAGHGAMIELVVNDRRGVNPVAGPAAFLLASPHEPASAMVTLRHPHAETNLWQVEVKTEAQSIHGTKFRVPPEVADVLGRRATKIQMGMLPERVEFFHWLRERNGNIPGIGLRCRTFAHGLHDTEVAHEGFSGTGTNWVAAIQVESQP